MIFEPSVLPRVLTYGSGFGGQHARVTGFQKLGRPGGQSGRQRTRRQGSASLMSIAVYWERLADLEDWQQDGLPASEANTLTAFTGETAR